MLTSISLWPLVRQTTPQIITIFSHISKLCITCFGTSALITCPCLLSRGPWNLWALHSGHSARPGHSCTLSTNFFSFDWDHLTSHLLWCLQNFHYFHPKLKLTGSDQDGSNGDQLEKNSISSQLDWCTALHHIQRVSTFDVGFLVSVHAYQTMHRFVKWKEHKLCRNEKRNIYHPFPSQSWSESKRDVERYDLLRRQWQLKPVKLLNQVRSQSFTGSTGWLPKSRQCFIKGSFPLNVLGVCQFVYFLCLLVCLVIFFIWCICLIVAFVCFMSFLFDLTTCK